MQVDGLVFQIRQNVSVVAAGSGNNIGQFQLVQFEHNVGFRIRFADDGKTRTVFFRSKAHVRHVDGVLDVSVFEIIHDLYSCLRLLQMKRRDAAVR